MADKSQKADLRSIPGEGTGPKPWRRRSLDETEQVTCWRCEKMRGVSTSAVVLVTLAPRRSPEGIKEGGTDVWACAHCLMHGEIIELIRVP